MTGDEIGPEPGGRVDPADRWSPWMTFGVATAVVACWLMFGARLVGLYVVLVDPVVILAYGAACAIAASRMRPGRGLSLRGMAYAVGFFAALSFVLSRPQIGFGDPCDVHIVVTILDSVSGEPVAGASVIAAHDGATLARATSDGRGVASLGFESQVQTEHSWLASRRTFTPDEVSVRVRAASYASSERRVVLAGERRVHPFEGPLGRPRKRILIQYDVLMAPSGTAADGAQDRASGPPPRIRSSHRSGRIGHPRT